MEKYTKKFVDEDAGGTYFNMLFEENGTIEFYDNPEMPELDKIAKDENTSEVISMMLKSFDMTEKEIQIFRDAIQTIKDQRYHVRCKIYESLETEELLNLQNIF